MREIMANVIILALASAFLAHFALIVKYGGYFIREPNLAILSLEIALLIGIMAFAILNIIRRLRR